MKPLDQDELYQHLSGFLKNKGVELKDGSYAQGIQKSCNLLSEAINLGHAGFERAKLKIDSKLDQMRQVIHETTAPKPPANPPPAAPVAEPAAAQGKTAAPKTPPRKPRVQKQAKPRKTSQA